LELGTLVKHIGDTPDGGYEVGVYIDATPDEIWGELFRRERIRPYYLSTILETTFESGKPIVCHASDGTIRQEGTVIECREPESFVHTLKLPGGREVTIVWTFQAMAGATAVRVVLRGLEVHEPLFKTFERTWRDLLGGLKSYIEGYCRKYPRDWPKPNVVRLQALP
jgi:hypothetical protein